MVKVLACTGFFFLGIIINCGGVPTDHRGYIGAHYWHDPGAFLNGFKGFCTVFVTASFAYAGTELTGLAAAEAQNPSKELPKAIKQVFWRISFFYIVNLFILGLIVPANNPLNASTADTEDSPFVLAIKLAGIPGLPSVFNVVICMSVLSVANSATFGSTRTLQALGMQGMAPKFLSYVDKKGRPIPTVILQLLFGLLAFIGEANDEGTVFDWLLALSGLANFFVWGSICFAHIRFRRAWAYNGHGTDELGFRALFGVWGSWIGLGLNIMCICAQFYVALFVSVSIIFICTQIGAFRKFWKITDLFRLNSQSVAHRQTPASSSRPSLPPLLFSSCTSSGRSTAPSSSRLTVPSSSARVIWTFTPVSARSRRRSCACPPRIAGSVSRTSRTKGQSITTGTITP